MVTHTHTHTHTHTEGGEGKHRQPAGQDGLDPSMDHGIVCT